MRRILVIDGRSDCVTALSQRLSFRLRHLRLHVDKADCASTALLLARSNEYALMIVDDATAGTGGCSLLDQLHALRPGFPLVVTLSGGCHEAIAIPLPADALAVMPAPLDVSALCDFIESFVGRSFADPQPSH